MINKNVQNDVWKSMAVWVMVGAAVILRLINITDYNFFHYDEAVWMGRIRILMDLMLRSPIQNWEQFVQSFRALGILSLGMDKSLWTFILGLRMYLFNDAAWFFPKLVSAICGVLTLGMTYKFAKRFFESKPIAILALLILCFLPSHIFYSRLGLQESFTMLCFLVGVYCYWFTRPLALSAVLSGVLFAAVFLSNYRMIILPVVLLGIEFFGAQINRVGINWRKYVWATTVFLTVIFGIGALNNGANTYVTFAWMFHQQDLSQGHFDWINIFSYPYYIFRLESFWYGLLFFGNIYFLVKRQWKGAFGFLAAVCAMAIFTLPQEKGVRYICFLTPFMVMSVAALIYQLWIDFPKRSARIILGILLVLMMGQHFVKAVEIVRFQSDYEKSILELKRIKPNATVISTQDVVQALFVKNPKEVLPFKNDLRYLYAAFQKGAVFLIIDPQAYVSYTEDGLRFSKKLAGPLEFMLERLPPVKVYPHFSSALLERFVLEHNENLARSIQFLRDSQQQKTGRIYVYDLEQFFKVLQKSGMFKQ